VIRRAAAVGAAALFLSGCGGRDPAASPERCGLPAPQPSLARALVPKALRLDGTDLLIAERYSDGVNAAFGAPWGVQEALGRYRKAARAAGFEIVTEDNEGFEAEIYLSRKRVLGFIQIRRSVCDDVSIVYFRTARPGR
jgi:hypothetical protein